MNHYTTVSMLKQLMPSGKDVDTLNEKKENFSKL